MVNGYAIAVGGHYRLECGHIEDTRDAPCDGEWRNLMYGKNPEVASDGQILTEYGPIRPQRRCKPCGEECDPPKDHRLRHVDSALERVLMSTGQVVTVRREKPLIRNQHLDVLQPFRITVGGHLVPVPSLDG